MFTRNFSFKMCKVKSCWNLFFSFLIWISADTFLFSCISSQCCVLIWWSFINNEIGFFSLPLFFFPKRTIPPPPHPAESLYYVAASSHRGYAIWISWCILVSCCEWSKLPGRCFHLEMAELNMLLPVLTAAGLLLCLAYSSVFP